MLRTLRSLKMDGDVMKNNSLKIRLFMIAFWSYFFTNITLYIKDYSTHYIIEGISFAIIVVITFFTKVKQKFYMNTIFVLYVCLVFSAVFPALLQNDKTGITMAINLFLPIVLLICLVNIFYYNEVFPKSLYMIPIIFGVVVSLQSLFLELMEFLGVHISGQYMEIEKNGGQIRYVYDYFLGLQSTIFKVSGFKVLRLNSYFLEPSKFACFLIIPLFLTFFLYKKKKKKIYLLSLIVITLTMFFTFSRAGYVSVIFASGIFLICQKKGDGASNKKSRHTTWNDLMKIIIASVALVGIVYFLFVIGNIISNLNPDSWLLKQFTWTENGKVSLVRGESSPLLEVFGLIIKKPYGYGMKILLHNDSLMEINVANALSLWAYAGGFVALIVLFFLMWNLFIGYAIPCMKSKNPIRNAAAVAFTAQTIFCFSYGTWIGVDYLYLIALMILFQKQFLINED